MKYARQAFVYTLGLFSTLGVDWLVMMLLPKLYGFAIQGNYSYAYSLTGVAYVFAAFYIRNYQVLNGYDKIGQIHYYSAQILMVILTVVLSAVYLVVSKDIFNAYIAVSFFLLLIVQLMSALANPISADFQFNDRLDIVGYSGILAAGSKLVGFLLCWLLTKNYIISLFVMCLESIAANFLFLFIVYRKKFNRFPPYKLSITNKEWHIITQCFPLCVGTLVPTFVAMIPKSMLLKYYNSEVLGYYTTLTSLSVVIPTLMNGITTPLLEKMGDLRRMDKDKELRKMYVFVIITFSLVCMAGSLVGYYPLRFLCRLVYGDLVVQYFNVLIISLISMVIYASANLSVAVITIYQCTKSQFLISALELMACFISNAIMIKKYSLFGAAWAGFFTHATYALINIVLSFILINRQIRILSCMREDKGNEFDDGSGKEPNHGF